MRFDVGLLARRPPAAVDWLADAPGPPLAAGCLGASTRAAAAFVAASERPTRMRTAVSRGGRPDLAGDPRSVDAPTLLIVGAPTLSCST